MEKKLISNLIRSITSVRLPRKKIKFMSQKKSSSLIYYCHMSTDFHGSSGSCSLDGNVPTFTAWHSLETRQVEPFSDSASLLSSFFLNYAGMNKAITFPKMHKVQISLNICICYLVFSKKYFCIKKYVMPIS